jgi:hypothetical protein
MSVSARQGHPLLVGTDPRLHNTINVAGGTVVRVIDRATPQPHLAAPGRRG